MDKRKWKISIIAWVIIFIAIAGFISYDWNGLNSYYAYNNSMLSYVHATVDTIESENLTVDTFDDSRYLGTQNLTVKILSGVHKGETVSVVNNLSRTSNVYVANGSSIILCIDESENSEPYYTVYNYDRQYGLLAIVVIFFLLMLLIGRKKGARAAMGLLVTICILFFFMINAIYHGIGVIPVTLLSVIMVCLSVLFILNGLSFKTLIAIVATVTGVGIAMVLCYASAGMLHISGYNLEDAEALVLISQATGLNVKYLLFSGVAVASLGAVMDVAVSITSALVEIYERNPELSEKELFLSGMNIGRDMIGTMSNTVILVFVGTSMTTVFLLMAYGYQWSQLVSSNYLAIQVIQALSSTAAVVLTVPVSTLIACKLKKYIKINRRYENV